MNKADPRKAPDHKALGKGLHALLPTRGTGATAAAPARAPEHVPDGSVILAPIGEVFRAMLPPLTEIKTQRLINLTESGRKAVLDLIRDMEHSEARDAKEGQPAFDFTSLRKTLGLGEL